MPAATQMSINIRNIISSDAPVLSDIARKSFFDTFTGTCSEDDMQGFLESQFSPGKLLEEIREEGNHFYFAEADGQPVAFIQFMEDYRSLPLMKKWKALELKRIYVLSEFHGRSIANLLMEHIFQFAEDNGYEVIWLGVWEHNNRAKRFYEKYGFCFSGHTHNFPIGNTPQTDQWLWKFLEKGEER